MEMLLPKNQQFINGLTVIEMVGKMTQGREDRQPRQMMNGGHNTEVSGRRQSNFH